MGRKLLIGWTGRLVIVALVVVAVVHPRGPTYGITLLGRPVVLVPPTPGRYAATVLVTAAARGLRASSDEFTRARAEAEVAAEQADDVSEIHDELGPTLTAAGGKHSGPVPPGQVEDALAQPAGQPAATVDGGVAEHDGQAYADRLAHRRTGQTFGDAPVEPDEITGAEQTDEAAAGWLAHGYGSR